MTVPTATADDLREAASLLRGESWSDDNEYANAATALEALAVQLPLMLEVVAAAEGLVEWWDPRDTDEWTRLQDAVRAFAKARPPLTAGGVYDGDGPGAGEIDR
jgi:hypothetical protein